MPNDRSVEESDDLGDRERFPQDRLSVALEARDLPERGGHEGEWDVTGALLDELVPQGHTVGAGVEEHVAENHVDLVPLHRVHRRGHRHRPDDDPPFVPERLGQSAQDVHAVIHHQDRTHGGTVSRGFALQLARGRARGNYRIP
jgi:hypothetical protein